MFRKADESPKSWIRILCFTIRLNSRAEPLNRVALCSRFLPFRRYMKARERSSNSPGDEHPIGVSIVARGGMTPTRALSTIALLGLSVK